MGNFLRYLLSAAAVVIISLWIFTVLRSCQENELKNKTTLNQSPTELNEGRSSDGSDSALAPTQDPGNADTAGDLATNDKNNSEAKSGNPTPTATSPSRHPDEMNKDDGRRLTEASAGSSRLPFLVIAGTYSSQGNAKAEIKRLKKLGYTNAEVVQFIGSRYYSVCIDRLARLSAARSLRSQVEQHTEEAYVHRRRGKK